jgi:hypothetical protein
MKRRVQQLAGSEEGQTSSEYVVMTAIAVTICLTVLWLVLRDALSDGVEAIGLLLPD